jgi:hypothetical protein
MNNLPPINLNQDGWKWEAFVVDSMPVQSAKEAVAAGQCDNYHACLVNMILCGITEQKGTARTWFMYGNKRVFIRFTRLSDGVRMTEWGNTDDNRSIMERLR